MFGGKGATTSAGAAGSGSGIAGVGGACNHGMFGEGGGDEGPSIATKAVVMAPTEATVKPSFEDRHDTSQLWSCWMMVEGF